MTSVVVRRGGTDKVPCCRRRLYCANDGFSFVGVDGIAYWMGPTENCSSSAVLLGPGYQFPTDPAHGASLAACGRSCEGSRWLPSILWECFNAFVEAVLDLKTFFCVPEDVDGIGLPPRTPDADDASGARWGKNREDANSLV